MPSIEGMGKQAGLGQEVSRKGRCLCDDRGQYYAFILFFFFSFFFFLCHSNVYWGRGISPSWPLHSSRRPARPGQHVAQFLQLPLARAHSLLEELERALVLGHLEHSAHLPDHVPHKLGVLCEAPAPPAVPRLTYVLRHFVALVEAHSHGVAVAQGHGCCSSMAATTGVLSFLKIQLLMAALQRHFRVHLISAKENLRGKCRCFSSCGMRVWKRVKPSILASLDCSWVLCDPVHVRLNPKEN